ncbi:MAG TPA: DUF3857 domain-containing protein, partial [Mucilaginibacter sp.]|nr:DUF3857 domain-containing protein [Mucilaginibacter sp.]
MNKTFTLALLCALAVIAKAQTQDIPSIEPFGKVDPSEIALKQCDFEPDANAEVLFDKGNVTISRNNAYITIDRHIRIKIFNDKAQNAVGNAANVRILYYSDQHLQWIDRVQAETINPDNGNLSVTKVDKKQMFTQHVDQELSAMTFTFPDVKPGSILDYEFVMESASPDAFPDWYFQGPLPTRYSELDADIPYFLHYKNLLRVHQPTVKQEIDKDGQITAIALANVPSISAEPYISSVDDNLQCMFSQLLSVNIPGYSDTFSENWNKVGEDEVNFDNFGGQFRRKLEGEEGILDHAKGLKNNDQKIAYIFDTVRNAMKWNGFYARATDDGTSKAWEKHIGNSAEINLILYHLLMRAGIDAYPIMLSTRTHGKVNPAYSNRFQFNTTAVYIPVDTVPNYVLDATGKY